MSKCQAQSDRKLSLRYKVLSMLLVLLGSLTLGGCALPSLDNREVSSVLLSSQAQKTPLGEAIKPFVEMHPNKSGIHLLGNPRDAFSARVLLAQNAERTIDVQYYIWEKDVTGTLLLEAINAAAKRGVRIRLLLDDNGIAGLDDALVALSTLDNVQVRIFNPFRHRSAKWLGYLTDFSRVNRRMHNKSFTVDNSVTVIGGRNIGDDYFGATSGILKQDLDLVAVGEVVNQVSIDFDKYWKSDSAYPINDIVKSAAQAQYTTAEFIPEQVSNSARDDYINEIKDSTFIEAFLGRQLSFEWADTKMISDDPVKGIGIANTKQLLFTKLTDVIGQPESSLLLVSPYFVLNKEGVEAFADLAAKGVSISVLTNSMQATDVLPVHAGYAKNRKALLLAGVKLYELRTSANSSTTTMSQLGPFGSSASSLHAKTFALDSNRLFVGSFNFDPRSMHLNTELGFVISSSYLTQALENELSQQVTSSAYQVKLDEAGDIVWIETNNGLQVIHTKEPGMNLLSRAALSIFTILPIDWLL